MELSNQTLTARGVALSKELDEACEKLDDAESRFAEAEHAYKMASSNARMSVQARYADKGVKLTVQEKEDMAFVQTSDQHLALVTADAYVRAARMNVKRVQTQVDIWRSLNSSQRAAMELV